MSESKLVAHGEKKQFIVPAKEEAEKSIIEAENLEEVAGLADLKEIEEFRENIQAELEAKAGSLGAKAPDVERCIRYLEDVVGIDLAHLEKDNLTRRDIETMRHSIVENLRNICVWDEEKMEKTANGAFRWNPGYKEKSPYSQDFFEKVGEVANHRVVPLGMLTLYLSSFGPAFLKELAGSEAEVEIGNQKITLKELAEKPKLMEDVDRAYNFGTPLDIATAVGSAKMFESGGVENGNDVKFSFDMENGLKEDGHKEKIIYIDNYKGDPSDLENLKKDMYRIGVCMESVDAGCSYSEMEEKSDLIAEIFAQDLKIPKTEVAAYINNFLHPQEYENIKIVGLDEFNTGNRSLQEEYITIQEKYGNPDITNDNWEKAKQEFQKWGEVHGYPDAMKALDAEKGAYENSTKKLEASQEKEYKFIDKYSVDSSDYNSQSFRKDVIQALEEDGYSIKKLKRIGDDNPEQVIRILSKTLGEKFHYDYGEAGAAVYNSLILELTGNDDFTVHKYTDGHTEGVPYHTLESGYGVCHDFSITMVAAKEVLEEEGVPVHRVFLGCADSEMQNHCFNVAAVVDKSGEVRITYIDTTWANSFLKRFKPLDAVDKGGEDHYYNANIKKAEHMHDTVEETKKKEKAILWLQEQIKQFLTQERIIEKLKARDLRREKIKKQKETKNLLEGIRRKIKNFDRERE